VGRLRSPGICRRHSPSGRRASFDAVRLAITIAVRPKCKSYEELAIKPARLPSVIGNQLRRVTPACWSNFGEQQNFLKTLE